MMFTKNNVVTKQIKIKFIELVFKFDILTCRILVNNILVVIFINVVSR